MVNSGSIRCSMTTPNYNAVKHNRENEFHRASLGALIKAMAAVHLLQVVQWCQESYHRFHGNRYLAFETVSLSEYGSRGAVYPCTSRVASY